MAPQAYSEYAGIRATAMGKDGARLTGGLALGALLTAFCGLVSPASAASAPVASQKAGVAAAAGNVHRADAGDSATGRPAAATWSISYPLPNGGGGDLLGVSCASSNACTAVGGAFGPVAARWDGTNWHQQQPADPASPNALNHSILSGVSCTASTACIAVGEYDKDRCDTGGCSAATLPFAERWNGARWSLQATPTLAGNGALNAFSAISCALPNACVAVGYRDDGTRPLAESWNGARWSIQNTPPATGSLNGVSCTSDEACTAVGSLSSGSGDYTPLAERWDGRRWSIQGLPSPGPKSRLTGVSCTSSSACLAVGQSFIDPSPASVTFAERWNGSSWSLQKTPDVGAYAELFGVSCSSNSACIAVGESYASGPDSSNATTLAEQWDGTRWTREPTPNSALFNPGGSYLHGVSCTTSAICTAVGNDQNNSALAEQRRAEPSGPGFTVTQIRTFADGTLSFRVTVPGSGRIDVLETAWNDNLAKTAVLLQPAPRRFVFARRHASAIGAGSLNLTVVPGQRGKLLVVHRRYRVTLRLWVSYTHDGGQPRTIGFYGLHLP